MKAIERYEELYKKAIDQNQIQVAFEIAQKIERKEYAENKKPPMISISKGE